MRKQVLLDLAYISLSPGPACRVVVLCLAICPSLYEQPNIVLFKFIFKNFNEESISKHQIRLMGNKWEPIT